MTDSIPDDPIEDIELPDADDVVVKEHLVHDAFEYDVAFKIAFVGLGQGGCRIAETFHTLGYRRIAAINSAQADLKDITDDIYKLDLGTGGAGQDMEKGSRFLDNREESVWDALLRAVGEDPDYILICVSLGGGTGSGGLKTLIGICRKYMEDKDHDPKRVGVILSLPNPYEGQRTARNAVQAFGEMLKLAPSPMVIIDNKRMEKLFKRGASDLFKICNKVVAGAFHLFNRLAIQRSAMITFDRADYATLLDSGIIAYGVGPITKYENKADLTEAIRKQMENTVLAEVNLKRAKVAGCIFLGGAEVMHEVPLEYFGEGFSLLGRMMADNSIVFRGVYIGTGKDLRCYTMMSGLPAPDVRLKELVREARLSTEAGGIASHLGIDD